jgi:multidrug efflux pump subunit AcrB
VAVFIPVAMIGGGVGLFFREFGWTAATAVLCSLLVARLLTPMLAARYMQGGWLKAVPDGSLDAWLYPLGGSGLAPSRAHPAACAWRLSSVLSPWCR